MMILGNLGHPIPETSTNLLNNQLNRIGSRQSRVLNRNNLNNLNCNMNNNMVNSNPIIDKNFQVLNASNNKLCTVNISIVSHQFQNSCLEVKVYDENINDESEIEKIDLNTVNKYYGIHYNYNDLINIFKLNTNTYVNLQKIVTDIIDKLMPLATTLIKTNDFNNTLTIEIKDSKTTNEQSHFMNLYKIQKPYSSDEILQKLKMIIKKNKEERELLINQYEDKIAVYEGTISELNFKVQQLQNENEILKNNNMMNMNNNMSNMNNNMGNMNNNMNSNMNNMNNNMVNMNNNMINNMGIMGNNMGIMEDMNNNKGDLDNSTMANMIEMMKNSSMMGCLNNMNNM